MFLSSIFYHDDFSPHEKYTPQEKSPGSAEFCVPSTWYRPWRRAEAEYLFVQGLYLPCLHVDTKEGGGTAAPSDCKVLLGIWPFTLVHISSPGCLFLSLSSPKCLTVAQGWVKKKYRLWDQKCLGLNPTHQVCHLG